MAQTANHRCPACGRTNRNGERAYGEFHRVASFERWILREDAERLANINLDKVLWLECHQHTFEPIALIETAQDIGQKWKSTKATVAMARRANVPAYLVLYTLGDDIDEVTKEPRVVSLRLRGLWPKFTPFKLASPQRYAEWLVKLRARRQEEVLAEAGRPDEQGRRRNHDISRLRQKQDFVPDQLDWFK